MQGVPPLDVPELLAYLVRQSSPFLDQIGIRKGNSSVVIYKFIVVILDCLCCLCSICNAQPIHLVYDCT